MIAPGCHDCNGACCRRYLVPVHGFDLHRLTRSQQLPVEAFARFSPTDPGSRGAFRLSRDDRSFRITLAHRDGGSTCTFLLELPGGAGRCGVYPHRPDVCAVFPMEMSAGVPVVRDDVACPPGRWEPLDSAVWAPALDRAELEWRIYETALERWDGWVRRRAAGDPADPAMLLAWLADLYTRLDPIRAELGEAGLAAAAADVGNFACGELDGPAADLIARCVWAATGLPGEDLRVPN